MTEFSRNQWIDACQFHELGQKSVLDEVASRVKRAQGPSPKKPTVVFDLDSTLYEVAPRTHAIIQEFVKTGQVLPNEVVGALIQLKHEEVGYSLQDTFESVGLDMKHPAVFESWRALKDFWWDRFFASAYLKHDTVYPGAPAFVHKVLSLGADVVYLTGRDRVKMLKGTLENLQRDGFPMPSERVVLILKEDPTLNDADYKRKAAEKLEKERQVIASFENEPHNVVALFESFPNAVHIFMETICSDKPARALSGLYRIRGFTD